MATTVYAHYKGWDIEIRYVKDRPSILRFRRARKFSASGVARLHKSTNPLEWIDSKPQNHATGSRVFDCGEEAYKQLMIEMKIRIDALKRKSGDCAADHVRTSFGDAENVTPMFAPNAST